MTQLLYRPWGHGEAPTEPRGNEKENIIGMELEIAELMDADTMNRLIEKGLIECEDTAQANIQLEREAQSNVEYELIFNADSKSNILDRLSNILELRHDVDQYHHEVSCHIHMNRYYIEEVMGLNEMDIYYATEAVAPLIYAISGRDDEAWNQWTPSCIDKDTDVAYRMEFINSRRITPPSKRGDRYDLTNLSNRATIEIRGFSNYYNFDYDLIKCYIELCQDLIMPLAMDMKGKEYADAPYIPIKHMQSFINEHMEVLSRFEYDLSDILKYNTSKMELEIKDRLIEEAMAHYKAIKTELEAANDFILRDNPIAAVRCLMNALEMDEALKLNHIDMDNLQKSIMVLTEQNQKEYKKTIWGI